MGILEIILALYGVVGTTTTIYQALKSNDLVGFDALELFLSCYEKALMDNIEVLEEGLMPERVSLSKEKLTETINGIEKITSAEGEIDGKSEIANKVALECSSAIVLPGETDPAPLAAGLIFTEAMKNFAETLPFSAPAYRQTMLRNIEEIRLTLSRGFAEVISNQKTAQSSLTELSATVKRIESNQNNSLPPLMHANQVADNERSEQRHEILMAEVNSLRLLITAKEERSKDPIDEFLNQEIDACRDFLNDYKPSEAQIILEGIRKRHWEIATDLTKFRIITNLGVAKRLQGYFPEAAALYLEAVQYDPNGEKALCNVTTAHCFNNDFDEATKAAKYAIHKYPDSSNAFAIYISTITDDPNIEDPTDLIPVPLLDTLEVAYALGCFFGRREEHDKDLKWMRKAYELDSDNVEIMAGLGVSLLMNLFRDEAVSNGTALSEEQRGELVFARDLLSKTWNKIKNTSAAKALVDHAFNLSSAEVVLGNSKEAEHIIEDALRIAPSNINLLRQTAMLKAKKGDFAGILEAIPKLPKDAFPEMALLEAECLFKTGKTQKAKDAIDLIIKGQYNDELKANGAALKIQFVLETNGATAACEFASKFLDGFSSYPIFLTQYALAQNSAGLIDEAKESASKANKLLETTDRYGVKMAVADAFFQLGLYEGASDIYVLLIGKGGNSHAMRQLLTCLLETDKRRTAFDYIQQLPEDAQKLPFYLNLTGALYRRMGKLPEAVEKFEAYLELRPTDLNVRLGWAEARYRLNEVKPVVAYLQNLPEYPDAHPLQLINLSQLLLTFKMYKQALALAYETRRNFPNEQEILYQYITIFLNIPGELEWLNKDVIESDYAVDLEIENSGKQTIIIDDRIDANSDIGEYPSSHLLSRVLMGKKKGNKFKFKQPSGIENLGKVIEVKHKYIHMFHITLNSFNMRFPSDNRMATIPVVDMNTGEHDFSALFKFMDDKKKQGPSLEEIYKTKFIPIGAYATVKGIHPFDALAGLSTKNPKILNCALGTEEEREEALKIISKSKGGIVLDPLTLLDVFNCGIQENILKFVGDIGIARTTLELISAHARQPTRQTVDIFTSPELITSLLEWATEKCTLLDALPSKDPDKGYLELANRMHPSFIDSLFAASGSSRMLVSNDRPLRIIGSEVFNVESVWLQPLLAEALAKQYITLDQYALSVGYLLKRSYHYTSVDIRTLLSLAKQEYFTPYGETSVFSHLDHTLSTGRSYNTNNIFIAVNFLSNIWNSNLTRLTKSAYTYKMLSAFTCGGCKMLAPTLGVFAHLAVYIAGEIDESYFKATIHTWCKGHFIKSPFEGVDN